MVSIRNHQKGLALARHQGLVGCLIYEKKKKPLGTTLNGAPKIFLQIFFAKLLAPDILCTKITRNIIPTESLLPNLSAFEHKEDGCNSHVMATSRRQLTVDR